MNGNYYMASSDDYINGNNRLLNKGKKVKVFITVPGSSEWQDKLFEGIIEEIGKDHIIISNPQTGEWNLILIIYIVFITFDEPINYR